MTDNSSSSLNPKFYLYDEGSTEELQNISIPKRKTKDAIIERVHHDKSSDTSVRIDTPVMTLKDKFTSKNEILKFPIESSHSYSYAQLSPNSLALRLNVLKRSLEILKDRPGLITSLETKERKSTIVNLNNKSGSGTGSSAALAAFFRPKFQRSDSFPTQEIYSKKPETPSLATDLLNNDLKSNDLKDIIQLLESNEIMISKNKDFASTLHDLSLTTNSSGKDKDNRYDVIKKRLIHALSTPFVDTSVMTTLEPTPINPSSVALNLLTSNSTPPNSRPFHSISSGKHALPQSVFTIDYESPWQVKAANDLACLMFGVSKNMIRSLTLMDLIAPQFREFVIDRLARSANGVSKIQSIISQTDIIFSGEIVAISRPGDKGYAWTSLWAKRKGKLIIFMFDQIPCDAFDIVISSDVNVGEFKVDSSNEIAGDLFAEPPSKPLDHLSQISKSIQTFLDTIQSDDPEDLKYKQSEMINERRYFTLQLVEDENIPCAVTSNALDIRPEKSELKIKIHSLPYIAGIFVINANDFTILSCNNAIARNLFGWSSVDLIGKTIDKLVPNFSKVYELGMNDIKNEFPMVQGLVLPEHFFRKYDTLLTQKTSESQVEEQFINSKGLIAKHMDGNTFNIDIQLRASAVDTYVLWITYSRSKVQNPVVDPVETVDHLRPIFKRARSISGDNTNFSRLPSQLKLFDEVSSLPTVGDITRHNSTRTPSLKGGRRVFSSSSADDVTASSDMSESPTVGTGATSISSSSFEPNTHHQFIKYSEQFLIEQENAATREKVKHSSNWPHEIGYKRRTKKINEFMVIRDMGEGAYGKVILAQHKNDPVYKIIIKCIDKERILVDTWVRDRKLGTIPSEIQIMSTLMQEKHPNIMRIIDFFEDERCYYLETPIFGNPPAIDLFDYIEVKKDMTEIECQFIFKQVVSAIFHLHKHGIVHRDIKDENVIVDERGIIKLIDFGSAGYTKSGPFDVFVGTIDYASPEVLKGEKYEGRPQDVWALGILLYTMLYKENPFYNVDEIMEGKLRLPSVIGQDPIELINKILVRDIDERPTITDIVEDPWLN